MQELISLLEKLGIQLLETAAPELISEAKADALIFLNQRLSYRQDKLKELKVLQHMATFGHGLLKYDVEVGVTEGAIILLEAAIKVVTDFNLPEENKQ